MRQPHKKYALKYRRFELQPQEEEHIALAGTWGESGTVLRSHTLRTCVGKLASDLTVKNINSGWPPLAFPASASAVAIGSRASSTCRYDHTKSKPST